MKRIVACCVAAGVLLAVCLITSRFAEAQPRTTPPTIELPTMPPVPAPVPVFSVAPTTAPVPKPIKKTENVYELLTKLADIKAKKAELDEAEKETTSLLKKELLNLQQQTQKLGVNSESVEPPQALNATRGTTK